MALSRNDSVGADMSGDSKEPHLSRGVPAECVHRLKRTEVDGLGQVINLVRVAEVTAEAPQWRLSERHEPFEFPWIAVLGAC